MSDRSHRLLVVANRTVTAPTLVDEVGEYLAPGGHVRIIVPALNSRLRHWLSDCDRAMAAAQGRVESALRLMAAAGLDATGEIGDADPALAIEDALAAFAADAVLISTWPAWRSNWLERGLIEHARAQVRVPVYHVVADPSALACAA